MLLAGRELADGPWVTWLRPVHAEVLLFGWTVQLVIGVAYWILPRFRTGSERGNAWLPWATFWLLNAGVLLVALSSTLRGSSTVPLAGRVLETLAASAFVAHALPRVKAFGSST